MMMQITEEQSINGALMLCSSGISTMTRFVSWAVKHQAQRMKHQIDKLLENACSAYRGGFVGKSDVPEMNKLISDLGGLKLGSKESQFFFLGNKTDLSYFWKKVDAKNHTILPRATVEAIPNETVRRNTIAALTTAKQEGLLSFDGTAYALTKKGKEAINRPDFVAKRLELEQKYVQRLNDALKIEGLDDVKIGDTVNVFEKDKPTEYTVVGAQRDGNDNLWINLEGKEDNIKIPQNTIGKVVFKDATEGEAYVKEHAEELTEYREIISKEKENFTKEMEKEQKPIIREYNKPVEETEEAYLVSVGENNYEKLEIPKADVEKLEDGSIKAEIYADKKYNVYTGDEGKSYTVDGRGVQELLGKGQNLKATAENTAKAAEKATQATVKTAQATANVTVNTADAAASAAPPVKIATTVVKVVYKAIESVANVAEKSVNIAQQSANSGLKV